MILCLAAFLAPPGLGSHANLAISRPGKRRSASTQLRDAVRAAARRKSKTVDEELDAYACPNVATDSLQGWNLVLDDRVRSSRVWLKKFPFGDSLLSAWRMQLDSNVAWTRLQSASGRPLPRLTAWYTAAGCTCSYAYGGVRVTSHAFPS